MPREATQIQSSKKVYASSRTNFEFTCSITQVLLIRYKLIQLDKVEEFCSFENADPNPQQLATFIVHLLFRNRPSVFNEIINDYGIEPGAPTDPYRNLHKHYSLRRNFYYYNYDNAPQPDEDVKIGQYITEEILDTNKDITIGDLIHNALQENHGQMFLNIMDNRDRYYEMVQWKETFKDRTPFQINILLHGIYHPPSPIAKIPKNKKPQKKTLKKKQQRN